MTSLREEIKPIINKYTKFYPHPNINDDFIVDDILSKFEKRIDEMINEIKKDLKSWNDFESTSNLESQIEMLSEWKEEMLK